MSASIQAAIIARGLKLPKPTALHEVFASIVFERGITEDMDAMIFDRGRLKFFGLGNRAARDAPEDELLRLIEEGRVERCFISTRPTPQAVYAITRGRLAVLLIIRP